MTTSEVWTQSALKSDLHSISIIATLNSSLVLVSREDGVEKSSKSGTFTVEIDNGPIAEIIPKNTRTRLEYCIRHGECVDITTLRLNNPTNIDKTAKIPASLLWSNPFLSLA